MADEVVGRGIIEIVGDSSKFSASVAQTLPAAKQLEDKLVDAAEAIGTAFQQAEKSTSVATDKIDGVTKRYIASVEREINTLKLSRDEYRAWEAQVKGISEKVYGPLIERLKQETDAQKAAAQAVRDKTEADRKAAATQQSNDSFIRSLRAQSDAIGKTQSEILELKAAQMGLSAQAAPYIAKLREQERALTDVASKYDQYGRTIKQNNAALRQVPAQITDIVVSLQGGQAPLTVLLQQGGQLKDVFGGVAPALRGLATGVLGLISPFTVFAAAAAAVIAGYAKGSAEADKYRQAISATGNVAGTTTGQLADYARTIAATVGTQGQAAETLAQFVSTGRVARDDLQRFAQTAIETQRATGKAVSDTVKEYAELGKDPVDASRRLNETTNYLTLAIFEQIKALKEQGKETEAATLAQRTYDQELARRASGIVENIGLIEKAWRKVKDATLGAVDAFANIGRAETTAQKLVQAQSALVNVEERLAKIRSGSTFATAGGLKAAEEEQRRAEQRVRDIQKEEIDARVRAANRGNFARDQNLGIDAEKEISRIRKETASNTEKLNKELKDYRVNIEAIRRANPNSALLDPARIAQDEANIRDKYKEKRGPRAKAFTDDAGMRYLLQLKETEASLRAQLETDEKLVASERELAKFNGQIAELKEKKILTAAQKALLADEAQIRAQLEANIQLEKQIRLRNDDAKAQEKILQQQREYQTRAEQILATAQSANEGRAEQFDGRLAVFGRGSQANEERTSFQAVDKEFRRLRDQLERAAIEKGTLGSGQYEDDLVRLKEAQDKAVQQTKNYYAQLREAQANWVNGATTALEDYFASSADLAGQTNRLFTDGLKGAEDALLKFVRTGKGGFKELASSIIDDLGRIYIKQLLVQGLGGSGGASGGSTFASLFATGLKLFGANGAGGGTGTYNDIGVLDGMRAAGGPVNRGGMYGVNENGPEILNIRGKQLLMMGNESGSVTPLREGRSGPTNNYFNINVPPGTSRETGNQIAAQAARKLALANSRNN